MARKGENIYLRKDGRWEARYVKAYDNENKIKYGYVYGKTYTEVKRKRNKIILTTKPQKNIKDYNQFNTIIDSWLLQKRLTLKESSYTRYYDIVKNHIRPVFGTMHIKNIDDDEVSKFLYLKKKSGLSNRTIKEILTILKQIAKYGKFTINTSCPKVKKKAIKVLNELEQKKLELYIKTNFSNIELGIFIALYMGLRIGEVCGLKWKDVNLSNNTIQIKRTVSRVKDFDLNAKTKTKIIIDEPKTESSKREIPIPTSIYGFLNIMKTKSFNNDNFILTNSSKPMEPRSYYNKYKKILKKLELGGFNFHALRHSFATRCIELGFDPKTLMEILGHSDIKITLAFYVHPSNELKAISMEKLTLLES